MMQAVSKIGKRMKTAVEQWQPGTEQWNREQKETASMFWFQRDGTQDSNQHPDMTQGAGIVGSSSPLATVAASQV